MNDDELLRYSRQILLPEFGITGQQRLRAASALIVGLGGLGSPAALYLAAAGIGQLHLADDDQVDLSNLQRQILHASDTIGRHKTDSACERLHALNPGVELVAHRQRLDAAVLAELVGAVDLVLDCCDNFATRFAVNAACVAAGVPLVSGAAIRLEGQIATFSNRPGSPCYRCLYADSEAPGETCAERGILAPLVGIIGAMQATEAVKVLTGLGAPLFGRLLLLDAERMQWRTVRLNADPACPLCSGRTS